MELSDSLTSFLFSKDFTKKSVQWYSENLLRFFTWLYSHDIRTIEDVQPDAVRRFIAEQRNTPGRLVGHVPSSATIHGYMRAIKSWLRWGVVEGLVDETAVTRLQMPKVEKKVIRPFDSAQLEALFKAADANPVKSQAARDVAILSVLLDTGIRAAELCGLTVDNVVMKPDESYITVLGKGRKERQVGLGKKSRNALHRYITRFRPNGCPYVFVAHGGTALTPLGLDKLLHRLRDKAGVTGVRVSAHTFRHTFSTSYMEASGDVFRLSRLLGHESVTTTEGYLKAFQATAARRGGVSVLDRL